MAATIYLSDGTTTLQLNDQTNYSLQRGGWSPSVASRRKSLLGGQGVYEDVAEDITLDVLGSTAAVTMTNVQSLQTLLDQADRWHRGENVAAVYLVYKPDGSTSSSNFTTVLTGQDGDTPMMDLPSDYNDVGYLKRIFGVRIHFKRRALWTTSIERTSSSFASCGEVVEATFTNTLKTPSPVRAVFWNNSSLTGSQPSIMLFAKNSSAFYVTNASALTSGSWNDYNTAADTANKSRSGTILRYTPTTTSEMSTLGLSVSTFAAKRFAVFAMVRNNSATTTFYTRMVVSWGSTTANVATGPTITIDTSNTRPRALFLGYISVPASISRINLYTKASAASGTLDFDVVYLMDVDDETSSAVAIFETPNINNGAASLCEYGVDNSSLTVLNPIVGWHSSGVADSTLANPLSYQGDTFLTSKSNKIAGVWLCPNGVYWRAVDTVPNVVGFSLRASRLAAYLIPQ